MPATKRHPLETFREEVRDKVDQHGYDGLTDREFTMLSFDWLLSGLANGNGARSRKQMAGQVVGIGGAALAALTAIGYGFATGIVNVLGG